MDETEELQAPRPRRSRLGIAMVLVGIVFALAAIPIAMVGFHAKSEASDAREAAAAAHTAQRAQEARRLKFARDRIKLEPLVTGLPTRAQGFASTVLSVGNAQARLRDITNRSALSYNAGDPSGATAIWQTDGKTALDELTATNATAQQQLQELHTMLQQLQELG